MVKKSFKGLIASHHNNHLDIVKGANQPKQRLNQNLTNSLQNFLKEREKEKERKREREKERKIQ
jgi:hypothetical protein